MVTQITNVLHFEKSRIELSQTGMCYTATFFKSSDTNPHFHFKFHSNGISIIDDFKNEICNYLNSNVLREFMFENIDVLRTFKLSKLIVN